MAARVFTGISLRSLAHPLAVFMGVDSGFHPLIATQSRTIHGCPELVPVYGAKIVVAASFIPLKLGIGNGQFQVARLGDCNVDETLTQFIVTLAFDFPGHGLTTATTYRFRGQPTTSPGTGTPTNAVFAFSNPADFDGISGSNIAKAAGYTITTGLYSSGAIDTSSYSLANFFHFTVDTDTATKGGVSGGGLGCSVGPVTLSA